MAIDLVAMDNRFFMVKFIAMEDYDFSKYSGSWMIFNHYLTVRPWKSNFDPEQNDLKKPPSLSEDSLTTHRVL